MEAYRNARSGQRKSLSKVQAKAPKSIKTPPFVLVFLEGLLELVNSLGKKLKGHKGSVPQSISTALVPIVTKISTLVHDADKKAKKQPKLYETQLKEGVMNAAGITPGRHEGLGSAITRLLYSLLEAGVDLEKDPTITSLFEPSNYLRS